MTSPRVHSWRALATLLLGATLAFAPALAEAKMGDLFRGAGSRGSRTFTPPPATRTAPSTAAPIERSVTPPSASQAQPGVNTVRPGLGAPSGAFGRGLFGGFMGGLLGAGLFGLLTGHGFFGGIGGLFSILGFLIQIALLVLLARMALAWWRNQNAAPAGAGFARSAAPGFNGGFGAPQGGAPRPRAAPLQLAGDDFNAFERLLSETQDAYSREDLAAMDRLMTPEMTGYFKQELDERRGKGLVNRISGVKLLQGDLSEAWREGSDDYASVAMRFQLIDVTMERVSGKVVSGDPNAPTQSTEVWTFRRPAGSGANMWKLSALQHAA